MPLVFNSIPPKTCESPVFNLNIISEEGEAISYGSSNNTIASVDTNGNVTIRKAGTVNITGYTQTYTGIRPLLINKLNQSFNLSNLDNLNVDINSVELPYYTNKLEEIIYSNSTPDKIEFSGNYFSGVIISGTQANSSFSYDISIDSFGKTFVTNAPGFTGSNYTGEVYVYTGYQNNWSKAYTITGGTYNSAFINLSRIKINENGDTIFIRKQKPDYSHYIEVYTGKGNQWNYSSDINCPSNYNNTNFGRTLSCSRNGDLFFTHSSNINDPSNIFGEVLIFKKQNNVWNYLTNLTGEDGGNDRFGWVIDSNFNGKVIVVGGYLDSEVGASQGAAWIFTGDNDSWSLAKKITGDGLLPIVSTTSSDFFGWDVSINNTGNIIAVGAWRDSTFTSPFLITGSVFIFTGSGSNWINTQKISGNSIMNNEGYFGRTIDLDSDGNVLLISAPRDNSIAGSVYIYTGENGIFSFKNKVNPLFNSNTFGGTNTNFTATAVNSLGSNPIALSKNIVLVGACGEINNSGALYQYNLKNYINIKNGGIAQIGINANATDCYNSLSSSKVFNIIKKENTLTFDELEVKVSDADIFNINARSNNILSPIQYSSSNLDVAEISNIGDITINGNGETIITAFQNEDGFYYSKSVSKNLKVIDDIFAANVLHNKLSYLNVTANDKNNFGYDVDINYSGDKIAVSNFTQNKINELINPEFLNVSNTGSVLIYSKDTNNNFILDKTLYGEKIVVTGDSEVGNIYFTGDNFFGKSVSFNRRGGIIAIGAPGIYTGIISMPN